MAGRVRGSVLAQWDRERELYGQCVSGAGVGVRVAACVRMASPTKGRVVPGDAARRQQVGLGDSG